MAYCMYLRKSRADIELEVKGEGETLARHQTILFDFAKNNGYDITAVYKEIVSGDTISARPEMQKLISEVSAGMWEGVIVMEIERLARGDTIDQGIVAQAFKYSNTKIITPYKTYDPSNEFDETFFEFNLFMSRQEYKTIRRRMQAGRVQSAKEGNFIMAIPPYGYKTIRTGKRDRSLQIVPEEAAIVRRIFDMYVNQGIGFNRIATILNQENVHHTDKVPLWSTQTICTMIHNAHYCGYVVYGRKQRIKSISPEGKKETHLHKIDNEPRYKGKHEPIIPEDLFNKAQEISKNKEIVPTKSNYDTRNEFSGLIICGVCGNKMQRINSRGGKSRLRCITRNCNTVSSYTDEIEEIVLAALQNKYNQKIVINKSKKPTSDEKAIIQQAEKDLKAAKTQKLKLYDFLEQGIYTVDVFTERIKLINEKITALEKILSSVPESESEIDISEITYSISELIDHYTELSPMQKNVLYKTIIKKIIYHKTKSAQHSEGDLWIEINYKF